MRHEVDLAQVRAVEVRVELRRGDVGVAQQLLHDAQVGTALQHVRCEAVAQRVRVQPVDAHHCARLGHERMQSLRPRLLRNTAEFETLGLTRQDRQCSR